MVIATQGGFVFENTIDQEILDICSIYQTPVKLLKQREPVFVKGNAQPAHPRSPISACRFKCI